MKSRRLYTALILFLSCPVAMITVSAGESSTPNAEAGKIKSVLCSGCHGLSGEGKQAVNDQPAYPRLAGQVPGYFIKSVRDYQHDVRIDPLMNALSKALTDGDIANLAAFYATLE